MGTVIAFPNSPFVDLDTVGLEVIVAPLGNDLIAWIRTERGFVILEQTPDWEHAIADGRSYAGRHRIPFRFQVHPFTGEDTSREQRPAGDVYVTPGPLGTETWDIVHVSASQDSAGTIGRAASFDEAMAEARRLAKRMGASFEGEGLLPHIHETSTLDAPRCPGTSRNKRGLKA